jgi:hypothetical protein
MEVHMFTGMGIVEDQAKRFFGRLWEDTIGYLRLHEFLKLRAKAVLTRDPLKLSSVGAFWEGLLGDRFSAKLGRYQPVRDGDTVKLRGFLTEWAPKLPGQLWTSEGAGDLAEGLKRVEGQVRYGDGMYTILDPWGKRKVLNAGHGSVRLSRGTAGSDHFAYMALVDEEYWSCDYGIPMVVSEPVFREFQRHAEKGAPAVKSLEGIVRTGSDLPLSQLIPRAIGAELSNASVESLRLRPGLPRCYVHIVSPLSIKFQYNDSHPDITAWTMYAAKHHTSSSEPYGYSYMTLNPTVPGQHEEATKFLQHYARRHDGVQFVTDYDGVVPRLSAQIPLTRDPISRSKPAVKELVQGIDRWADRMIKKTRFRRRPNR